ncbi:MAG: carboxypeptidase-like regulatory domain-containing protein [Christiangramia sp.]
MNLVFKTTIRIISLTFFLFISLISNAQESIVLNGKVEAGTTDIEKIHVINLNLEKGSVTDVEGNFQIPANENDSLYVSSVQFQNKTIVVTKEMVNSKKLIIQLENKVNELAEVIIDDIQLSGHLANDLNKISVKDVERKYLLQNDLNSFIEKDRKLNPYGDPNPVGGINLNKIAGTVINKLSKNSEQPKTYSSKELANKSIKIVGHEFFRKTLDLEENEICNFVYFCTEDSRFKRLVINNNAFVLIEYFQTRINEFRERRGTSLNNTKQIPG